MTISDLIGSSAKFQTVVDDINLVAPVDSAVLVQGETGTGKEVIARAIHEASPRRKNRFVAFNCAAIPSALLENELFGHEKGAFTGAVGHAVGRFQAPTTEHCFWMRSEIFRSKCNQNFCAFFRKSSSSAWAAAIPFKSTCGSSRLPTRICGAWWKSESSAPIFTTG